MLPDTDRPWLVEPNEPAEALVDVDLRDASSSIANTCEALRLSLVEADLDAACAVLRMLIDQAADLTIAVGQLLQPLMTETLESSSLTPDERHRFVTTALSLFQRPDDQTQSRTSQWVWLSSTGGDVEPLIVALVAVLMTDAGVPIRVLDGAMSIAHIEQMPVRSNDVMFLSVPAAVDISEMLRAMNWFHGRGVPVVVGGRGVRDEPGLAKLVGAQAGAWSVTDATSQLLRARGPLTDAESVALCMAADGYTNVRMAHELDISVSAVKARLESAYQRINADDRAHAVAIALRNRWIR